MAAFYEVLAKLCIKSGYPEVFSSLQMVNTVSKLYTETIKTTSKQINLTASKIFYQHCDNTGGSTTLQNSCNQTKMNLQMHWSYAISAQSLQSQEYKPALHGHPSRFHNQRFPPKSLPKLHAL